MVYRKPKHVVRFGQHNVLSEDVVVINAPCVWLFMHESGISHPMILLLRLVLLSCSSSFRTDLPNIHHITGHESPKGE